MNRLWTDVLIQQDLQWKARCSLLNPENQNCTLTSKFHFPPIRREAGSSCIAGGWWFTEPWVALFLEQQYHSPNDPVAMVLPSPQPLAPSKCHWSSATVTSLGTGEDARCLPNPQNASKTITSGFQPGSDHFGACRKHSEGQGGHMWLPGSQNTHLT